MRKFLIFILFVGIVTMSAVAQENLNVSQLFDGRFQKSPNAVEIYVTGKKASSIGLNKYHSITITNDAAAAALMVRLVLKDGTTSVEKEVEYRGGKLYYGFYRLHPAVDKKEGKRVNRYLFYLNHALGKQKPEEKVTLIYMDGKVSSDYVKSLIKK